MRALDGGTQIALVGGRAAREHTGHDEERADATKHGETSIGVVGNGSRRAALSERRAGHRSTEIARISATRPWPGQIEGWPAPPRCSKAFPMKLPVSGVAALLLVACSSSTTGTGTPDGGASNPPTTQKDAGLVTSKETFDAGLKVFVTENQFDGALGGTTGAAKRCQTAAEAAGLAGTFVAVLGTSTTGAFDAVPSTVDGPWYANHYPTDAELNAFQPLEDGAEPLAFRNRAALKGFPARHIGFNEMGVDISRQSTTSALSYWTGAEAQGEPSTDDCAGWTSKGLESGQTGSVHTGTTSWITGLTTQCTYERHLLCIQIK